LLLYLVAGWPCLGGPLHPILAGTTPGTSSSNPGASSPGASATSASATSASSPEQPAAPERGPLLTQRRLQVVLGLLWLLDAGLQFQPYMFTKGFVANFLAMNAMYQPRPIGELIIHLSRLLVLHPAAWNALFATTQLVIAVGILWRRTVRFALAVSFVWVLGVWAIGEGFGGMPTGIATLVGGAPGAVLLYGLIGLLVWPSSSRGRQPAGSSVASEGPLGERGGLVMWAVLWCGGAILQVLPGPYPPFSVLGATVNMNLPEPSFIATIDRAVVGFIYRAGDPFELVLAAVEALIGIQALKGGRRLRPVLYAGIAVSLVFWALGQNFGGILTGHGTDPNAGPLYVLLAICLYPRRVTGEAGTEATPARLEEART
ncbi:MAG: hypothetical protein ACYDH5_01795, partial [Acidimicrobiales bacterium]